MANQVREIQYFFSGQNFTDGIRITLGILLPAVVFAQLEQLLLGVLLSIGALSVSIADFPGPPLHKRNGMLLCCLSIFLVAFITGFARMNPFVMGLEVLMFCFFFSMLAVWGQRAAAIGIASLLVMVLSMDEPRTASEILFSSSLVLAGGVWYFLLSLLFYRIRPYRPVQQALGECAREMAKFLALKASFYGTEAPLEEVYQKIVAQQIVVNEKQEAVREVLFKSRQLVKESTHASRRLLLIFVDLVDLFEQMSLIHYDYGSLRVRFGKGGVLEKIADIIKLLANELDNTGFAIQANARYRHEISLDKQLEELLQAIEQHGRKNPKESTLVLKKIWVNINNISQRLNSILAYQQGRENLPQQPGISQDFTRFVSPQSINLSTFQNNLSFHSSIFKHSLRVALVCLFGYGVTLMLPYGEHSYWVLLTIVVILKPAFSLTKERNYQRLAGTIMGGIIGFCILLLVKDQTALFVMLVLLMVGTFSFIRVNYVLSVTLMTPFILIIFNFLGNDNNLYLLQERVLDTIIGSAIAFSASYLVFPSWEAEQLQQHMQDMLRANDAFLQKLAERMSGRAIETAEYKLARKEVYVSAANLAAAFQRMLSEPKSKQINQKEVHKFVVLNHVLSSSIATLGHAHAGQLPLPVSGESLRTLKRARMLLAEAIKKLGGVLPEIRQEATTASSLPQRQRPDGGASEDPFIHEQLAQIFKLSQDIRKSVATFLGEPA